MNLSRLRADEKQIARYQKELEEILDYFSVLEKVDTDNVEPIAQITDLKNIWREDSVEPSDLVEKLIANAPNNDKKYIKVKQVFE